MSNIEKIAYDKLVAMTLDQLTELADDHVTLKTNANKASKKFKSNMGPAGKVLAAFQVRYVQEQTEKKFSVGISFKEYHKNATGEEPNNHAQQCAVTFNALVITAKIISETDYDNCHGEWLKAVCEIIGEAGEELTHPSVIEAAAILHDRPSDGSKQLREIKAELKGNIITDEGEKEVSGATVIAMVRAGINKGMHSLITSELTAAADNLAQSGHPEAILKAFFQSTIDLSDRWALSGIPKDTLVKWRTEYAENNKAKAEKAAADKLAAVKALADKANADKAAAEKTLKDLADLPPVGATPPVESEPVAETPGADIVPVETRRQKRAALAQAA